MEVRKTLILDFIRRSYHTACTHGFHDKELSNEHMLMLVLSEIGEMVEADRKNRRADVERFNEVMSNRDSTNEIVRQHYFETFIKDTLEDELADVAIRLFDFCGTRDITPSMASKGIVDMSQEFNALFGQMSVCEQCYTLSCLITGIDRDGDDIETCMGYIIAFCFEFAAFHGIDLEWHITQKMRYNETRERKHGKQY